MPRYFKFIFPILALLAAGVLSGWQDGRRGSGLIGTWHNVTEPQYPQAVLLFGEDGYYAEIAVSPGRREPANDFDHRTKEELAKQFGGLRASWGSWQVDGDKLLRHIVASHEPANEGKDNLREFRVEGDTLVLIAPNTKDETRYRRLP